MNAIEKLLFENSNNPDNIEIIKNILEEEAQEAEITVEITGHQIEFFHTQESRDLMSGAAEEEEWNQKLIFDTLQRLKFQHAELF